jgi:hypothetical protein
MSEWSGKYTTEVSDSAIKEVYDGIFKRRVVELETTYEQLIQKEELTTQNS